MLLKIKLLAWRISWALHGNVSLVYYTYGDGYVYTQSTYTTRFGDLFAVKMNNEEYKVHKVKYAWITGRELPNID